MKFIRPLLLLSLALLATGCASTEQLAQRNEERCAARGFARDSDAFKNCLVDLDSERDARMEANRRRMLEQSSPPYIPAGSNR
jgi:hypothetical protein